MQNIQDLKDKIFFESKNIIDILGRINNVDELISKHDLLNDLVEKIAFLKLLDKNLGDHQRENLNFSAYRNDDPLVSSYLVTEEEAIFNNELNEIGNNPFSENENKIEEEEAIFNNQLNEIIESDFYENIVNLAEEDRPEANENFVSDEISDHLDLEEEAVFNNQLNEIDEEPENTDQVLSFVDEERILEDSQPESDDDFNEDIFNGRVTEEEAIFSNQLNEIIEEENANSEKGSLEDHINTEGFETESNEVEMLMEETEYVSTFDHENDEIITENSNVESILSEIKKDPEISDEERTEFKTEDPDRRKIVDIDKPQSDKVTEVPKSDESFEDLDDYHQKQKIKLANIRGLRSIQTLFDDDPLERETPHEKVEIPVVKEDTGSLIKTNIPTQFMEAEKQRPEFKLDLNDRIAFTKVLFNGSQTDLNLSISELNKCKDLEEAKEFLSELYYDRKWDKVDEYAQRLWVLVENKFL
ncbi:hypothetical protein [Chryseobacterium sp. NKUCC03_KSP]|uniref:hypothetical protein n=1 Tax=Chryseobacterium sp. NKUCC03_KSP TaxID=2842125 RepID=UPI001C5B6FA4|nr:hypothetical protein [Chryseobacterium sp. NKUCC03_KSP]MBW3524285.1 hypothetical protein [Chryseobacterium sp. NKUCC03_KSP]